MIKPLLLGNKLFPVNLIQGPLAGISCAPFRTLIWQYSQPAYTCTEMISCKTLIHQSHLSQARYIAKHETEGPLCVQLSGSHPLEIAEAVKIATDQGADLIDLNCGCPVKKIRRKGAGSSLLTNTSTLYQLIKAMKQNTSLPVSIKIRVQANSNEQFNQSIINVVKDAGADFLVVHGRHWTEKYDIACHYDEIRFFVENLNIPVIGNGDIENKTSLKTMLETGCAGVMIGRAGVGQPWLISQLAAELMNQPYSIPSHQQIGLMFIEHVLQLAALLKNEKFAILQARKFAKYYARPLANKMDFSEAIQTCDNVQDLRAHCLKYFI